MIQSNDLRPTILYPARLSFKNEGEIKSFPDKKQQQKECITTKPVQENNVKESSLKMRKKKIEQERNVGIKNKE